MNDPAPTNRAAAVIHEMVMVINENGMHMTPCSQLVRLTQDFAGSVRLANGEREADCKSILALLLLAAGPGTVLSLTVTGDQADAMVGQIIRFFESGFNLES